MRKSSKGLFAHWVLKDSVKVRELTAASHESLYQEAKESCTGSQKAVVSLKKHNQIHPSSSTLYKGDKVGLPHPMVWNC